MKRKPILAGNGTFYKHHEEARNPISEMVDGFLDKRAYLKSCMFANGDETSKIYKDLDLKQGNEKKLAKIFSPKKPVITYALIVLNIMVYLFMLLYDTVDQTYFYALANDYEGIQNGQIYRLITSMFLHSDIIHIACNMYALYILGPVVERYYGKTKFLIIYMLSGILGSIFSAAFMSADTISIGASGAIFGLLGSIAYFTYYYRATLQGLLRSQILPVILLNLALGFMIPGIDVSGHIGGLIGGILVSMAIGIGDKGRTSDQINGIIVYILMTAAMLYMVFIK